MAVLEERCVLAFAQGEHDAIRLIFGDRIDENLIGRIRFHVDTSGR